jgi:lipopolysaccharide transport system ATP-binding protein
VTIPGNFLNDGVYFASVQAARDSAHLLFHFSEILVFEVLDSARRDTWFGKRPGVVRPKLEWISQNVGRIMS